MFLSDLDTSAVFLSLSSNPPRTFPSGLNSRCHKPTKLSKDEIELKKNDNQKNKTGRRMR